jgi:KDO2-lipid IV(A) lauroyltransferase
MKPKRIEIMHANIRRAFPEKSESEIEEFGKRVYRELSKTVAEIVLLYNERIHVKEMVINTEEAVAKLKSFSQNAPNGILMVAGHYSNWELLGLFLGYHGFSVTNVVKPSKNALIDKYIVIPFRERSGNKMIELKGSMISMAKALKAGKNIALLIDQVVQPPNGVPVSFFGHPTAATKSVAMLKSKYDPLVIPVFIERVESERFMVRVGDPIEYSGDSDIEKEKQLIAMTQMYYDVIEEQIQQAPEQWLWLYNRWKEIKFAS